MEKLQVEDYEEIHQSTSSEDDWPQEAAPRDGHPGSHMTWSLHPAQDSGGSDKRRRRLQGQFSGGGG